MKYIKTQKFGIEIEFTGITREKAAKVAAEHFGTTYSHNGGSYDEYSVNDSQGRKWKFVSDASIKAQKKLRGQIVSAGRDYSVELVRPICTYSDIEAIQELARKLRKAGGFVNKSVGIHIHADGSKHTPKSIKNFINIIASKNNLLYKSLQIDPERMRFCKALDKRFVDEINRKNPKTMGAIADIWYRDSYTNRVAHYNDTRYHFLNLHSFFNGVGTCEIRGYVQ